MAVAFDFSSSKDYTSGATFTWSHTCSGTNNILIVGTGQVSTTDVVTGITFNGNALTKITSFQNDNQANSYTLWYILGQSGVHNIIVSSSNAAIFMSCVAASYSGASQTGQMDSSNSATGGSGTTPTISTTVVAAADAWLVGINRDNAGNALTASTQTFKRVEVSNIGIQSLLSDSNGVVGTGAQALTWTQASGTYSAMIIASIKSDVVRAAVSDTNVTTDSVTPGLGVVVSDTNVSTDSSSGKFGFKNQTRSTGSWTNQTRN